MSADDRAGAVFSALADPTRRHLLTMVGRAGPVSATELAAELPISRQAVVKHLNALRAAGLVEAERAGKAVQFELTPGALDDAAAWMAEVGDRWERRLVALKQRAAARMES